jgi:hypothetical protein
MEQSLWFLTSQSERHHHISCSHCTDTSLVVQPGYHGALTLELVNDGETPIALYPGLRVAQLSVHRLAVKTDFPYEAHAKYVSPVGPEPPKLAWDASEVEQMKLLRDRLSKL